MAQIDVAVLTQAFQPGALLDRLGQGASGCGATASFVGQVRSGGTLTALELEHYPGVTENALQRIADHACGRWSLHRAIIVHRVGRMEIGDPIVFVGAAAPHRRAALDGVSFMIDVLKTQAPFWKKEITASGSRWVEPRADDNEAAAAWLEKTEEVSK